MKAHRRLWVPSLLGLCLTAAPVLAQGSTRCGPSPASPASSDLLALDLESLLKVKVITASKSAEAVADAPGVISVVSSDELRRFGSMTLREILERVPGLSGTTAYFTDRSLVAARGDQTKIDGGHILILINGRPSREVLEGGIVSDLLESFPVDVLERVEVVKGPGSVLYGSNAFSAVINLITQKPESSGFTINGLPAQAGGFSTSGQAMYRCGDLSVIGSAQFRRKPEWNTSYRLPQSLAGDPFAAGLPAVQAIDVRDLSSGAYVGVNYKGASFMSSFTDWQTAAFVRGNVGESHWKRGFADVGYALKPKDTWDMSVNLTYTRNTFNIQQFPDIGRDSSEIVLEWTNAMNLTGRDRVTFGTLYNHVQGHELYFGAGPAITISDGSRSAAATYGQMDHRLVKGVKLIGGLQANWTPGISDHDLDLDVVPRAGVIWSPGASFNVKALYSKAFRAPSINETRLNHPGLAGNPALRPEKVGTFDLGATYEGNQVHLGINYFHSRQTDSIVVGTFTPRWRYLNLGGATFQGIELEGKYYFKKDLYLLGSMLHQANEDSNGVQNGTPIANNNVKAGVSYDSPSGVMVSLFDSFEGAIAGYGLALNPLPDSRHVLNANVRFDLSRYFGAGSRRGVSLVVNAENVTNNQVWLPDWGGNSGDTIPTLGGRTIYFGVELSSKRSGQRIHSSAPKDSPPVAVAN